MKLRAVVSVILQSPYWKEGLRVSYPPHLNKENQNLVNLQQSRNGTIDRGKLQQDNDDENINNGTTPFRELIKTMPGTVIIIEIFSTMARIVHA